MMSIALATSQAPDLQARLDLLVHVNEVYLYLLPVPFQIVSFAHLT